MKNKKEPYEKPAEMSRKVGYTTRNLLNFLHHKKYCNIIGIDVSRQTNISIPQQINLAGKLVEDDSATLKSSKNYSKLFLDSLIVTE